MALLVDEVEEEEPLPVALWLIRGLEARLLAVEAVESRLLVMAVSPGGSDADVDAAGGDLIAAGHHGDVGGGAVGGPGGEFGGRAAGTVAVALVALLVRTLAGFTAQVEVEAAAVGLQAGILERLFEMVGVALEQLEGLGAVGGDGGVDHALLVDVELDIDPPQLFWAQLHGDRAVAVLGAVLELDRHLIGGAGWHAGPTRAHRGQGAGEVSSATVADGVGAASGEAAVGLPGVGAALSVARPAIAGKAGVPTITATAGAGVNALHQLADGDGRGQRLKVTGLQHRRLRPRAAS